MNIVLCLRSSLADDWLASLRARLDASNLRYQLQFRSADDLQVKQAVPQADVAIVWKPPAALFEEQRQLKAVFNLGAGVDALLSLPNLPPQAMLVRLEDAGMSRSMTEYVLAAVLRVYRGFDRYAHQQTHQQWQQHTPVARDQYQIGVLGLGVIGEAIASQLATFGFAVRGFARSQHQIKNVRCFAGQVTPQDPQFCAFATGLNVLINVLPATADTKHALHLHTLSPLANGAHLINVGRGNALVEGDLLSLLDNGKLANATLDVFENEPLPAAHPFWSRPNILITPHVSALTEKEPSLAQVVAKLVKWSRAESISGVVDRARGY